MKKRILSLLTAILVMSALVLTACGGGGNKEVDLSDSKYVGTWKAAGISLGGETENLDDEWIMTLKEDGTGTLTGTGEEENSEFTWQPTDGGFKTKGDLKVAFKDDGDKIKTNILGVDLTFEKQ